ncbi:MAG: DUF3783 domain-containing protein [Thermoplasmatota archaeon]
MGDIGVMLYGFDGSSAEMIKEHIERNLGSSIILISGSGKEQESVLSILEDEEHSFFEDKIDPKVVMFLGFDGPMIHRVMDSFPGSEEMQRPIFCTPTDQNIHWKLHALLEDLMEEREYFRRRAEEGGASP